MKQKHNFRNSCTWRHKPILDNLELNHIIMIHHNSFGKIVEKVSRYTDFFYVSAFSTPI